MNIRRTAETALNVGEGILHLAPAWVPRSFCRPGQRIRLHPDDYFALGLQRGGIDERWLSSTTPADNGPGTPENEGLSYVVFDEAGRERVTLRDAIAEFKAEIIGETLWNRYRKWPMFSKFFDNLGPLPHHIHHRPEHAALVGQEGKPEMYFFPSQMNNHGGEFPYTFFGFSPGTTREQVRACLEGFGRGDNRLLDLSRCFQLTPDTGWDVPPGILHAPGSLCTYEPQFASDVYAMYQSVLLGGHCVPESLLWKDCPKDRIGDISYLLDVIDWESNLDPDFHRHRFMPPLPVRPPEETMPEGYREEWICYRCKEVSAKRLTVLPGRTVRIRDAAAHGCICIQGHGRIGSWPIESPTLIRYGQLTSDEFFITEPAAREGIEIRNESLSEELVLLKHFAWNDELPS